jgi:erythronate-4-phosphate dehydrogenase
MKIYYEDSMPYALEFFAEMAECVMFSHKTVTAQQLADADVLLVRSTTKVNAALLADNNQLIFVGTATAGTDHVDQGYLHQRQLPFVSAGGCNAIAVAEYVLSAITVQATKFDWQLSQITVGIVGAGHVGTALANTLTALGITYKLCDPPLADQQDPRALVAMEEIMACDVISLHVPFVDQGRYKTQHLFDQKRLQQLNDQQLLINACRGEVIDNKAALTLFQQGSSLNLVLDVWENEPNIDLELVPYVALATAHIAGHTIEGKARGTEMLYLALCKQLGVKVSKQLSDYLPAAAPISLPDTSAKISDRFLTDLILSVYNVAEDDRHFKNTIAGVDSFRYIRKHYPIRREFSAIRVNAGNSVHSEAIYRLGFLPLN